MTMLLYIALITLDQDFILYGETDGGLVTSGDFLKLEFHFLSQWCHILFQFIICLMMHLQTVKIQIISILSAYDIDSSESRVYFYLLTHGEASETVSKW